MKKIIAEGHRGFCAEYPENTLISFEKAIELGVDAVEFDIWLSTDKVPVLMHDSNANRTCRVDREIRHMSLAEIKQLDAGYERRFGDKFKGAQVPTLRELLELRAAKRPDLKLGVEIKHFTEECVDITMKLLKEFGVDVAQDCWFYAFNGRVIRYMKEKYGARTMAYPDFLMSEFDGYDAYDEIGIPLKVVNSEAFDIYWNKGLPVHMYCADTEEDVRMALEKGAIFVTANDPRPLLEVLRGK